MLSKAKTLQGYSLQNTDGETIGNIKEFYFDDRYWTGRYPVADTGNWLTDRQVLLSPYALAAVNSDHQNIVFDLTKKQLEDSPPLDNDKPVSRQFEQAYYGHYGYPTYWSGQDLWGLHPYPVRDRDQWKTSTRGEKTWDPHLRSTYGVSGHHIQAMDGEVGHVEDFVIDDETWAIRYAIVDTHNWWPDKKVLVSTRWLQRVSWGERKVFVNLSREAIRHSPAFTGECPPTRDYETVLHLHYGRPGYWVDERAASVS